MRNSFQERTEQKLRYAQIHFEELRSYHKANSNDDWENAHQEGTFFPLLGAVESLLQEINAAYSLGLGLRKVKFNKISNKLSESNQSSTALDYLNSLRNDPSSWLALLIEWRNHGTHRKHIGKQVNFSTSRKVENQFFDPRTGQPQTVFPELGCLKVLKNLIKNVRELIDYCREVDPRL